MGCIDFFSFRWFLKDGKITAMGMDFLQVIASYALSVFLPMFIFYLFSLVGVDVTYGVYVATLIFLNVMSILILTECFVAYFHKGAPSKAGAPEAPASAIICAYMPNEAETIMETLEHFLSMEYEPGIQVILSYNTPVPMPIEDDLRALSNQHPNLLVLKIENSRSKSQNLNAALDFVVGDFVGVFDADHQPDLDSYSRAWRWLSNGYDVVQGHCLSRNPEETWMAKMVAIEFETIYAVAHPGRTVRDGFGVFGGSNGYWKSPLLKRIGMLGSMLTEDIDSSMRVLAEGGNIGTDPKLISRELSTTTALHTWNQRLRWAQGWMQVSMKHCFPLIMNNNLGLRQKFGMFMLLFIREIYPWIASQIITLLLYWYIQGRDFNFLDPLLLSATAFTTIIGPVSTAFAFSLCHPSLKNPWWFVQYAIFSLIIYTDAKNVCCRVAHIKQAAGESAWRVTPRSAKAENMAIEEGSIGEAPKETEIKSVGEPSMSVMSLSQLSKSGLSTFSTVAESRNRFREELSQASRNRFHYARNAEESSQIGESSKYHVLTHIEWSKPGHPAATIKQRERSRASRDHSRASHNGGYDWSFRGLGIDYSISKAPSMMPRRSIGVGDVSQSIAELDAENQFWSMKEEGEEGSNRTGSTDEEEGSPKPDDYGAGQMPSNSRRNSGRRSDIGRPRSGGVPQYLTDVVIDEDTPSVTPKQPKPRKNKKSSARSSSVPSSSYRVPSRQQPVIEQSEDSGLLTRIRRAASSADQVNAPRARGGDPPSDIV